MNLAVFQTEDGALALRADTKLETIWANLEQIAQLFARDKSVISRHIRNIFLDEELNKESTVAFFATVQKEGMRKVSREIEHFNLDVFTVVTWKKKRKTVVPQENIKK